MIINKSNISSLFVSFNAAFTKGRESAPKYYKKIALTVPSKTSEEQYGWLAQLRGMREWLGPRHVHNVAAAGYSIKNKTFETTIGIPRPAIEDDSYGVFTPVLTQMGDAAENHPDEMVFTLLKSGFTTNCYDGQSFFNANHPVDTNGVPILYSNTQAGAGAPWFLLDTSKSIKPIIHQERLPYELQERNDVNDDNVFNNDEFVYGVRGRLNVGFGLWQLAYASKDVLNAANYELARSTMQNFKGEGGRPLNITPTTLVVPPSLEGAALRLLNTDNGTGGVTNEWKGTAEIIVTPWVS